MNAKSLWETVKNASLFAKKDTFAGGVKLRADGSHIYFTTSDNYVTIEARCESRLTIEPVFVSIASLLDLEKCTRTWRGDAEPEWLRPSTLLIRCGEVSSLPIDFMPNPNQEWWDMMDQLMDRRNSRPAQSSSFGISPLRFAQLGKLEPKNQYPASFAHNYICDDEFIAFRYGPDTRGVLAPLRIGALEDAFGDRLNDILVGGDMK